MINVFVICTGNSCRSVLGEALFNHLGAGRIQAFSAGSHSKGKIKPVTLATLQRHGLPTQVLKSQSWSEFANQPMDIVITVCDNAAEESCPVYLNNAICVQSNFLEEYSEISLQLTESLQCIVWKYSLRLSTEAFIARQIENIAELQQPAYLLKDRFKGETAIILAGGPSLTDLLPWIKKNRDKLVILSVARVSRQLIKAQVTPDFIFSVDPHKESFDNSYEMLFFDETPIFVHANHVYPGLLNQWHGKSVYLGARLPWLSPLNIENVGSIGPTVTNSALQTADYFGFERILLAGVDLCYTKSGITHAEGSDEQAAGAKYNTTSLRVKTYSGEYRGTGEDFFAAFIVLIKGSDSITIPGPPP